MNKSVQTFLALSVAFTALSAGAISNDKLIGKTVGTATVFDPPAEDKAPRSSNANTVVIQGAPAKVLFNDLVEYKSFAAPGEEGATDSFRVTKSGDICIRSVKKNVLGTETSKYSCTVYVFNGPDLVE